MKTYSHFKYYDSKNKVVIFLVAIKCPYCQSKSVMTTTVTGNMRSEHSWEHDAYTCNRCGSTFTIWDKSSSSEKIPLKLRE